MNKNLAKLLVVSIILLLGSQIFSQENLPLQIQSPETIAESLSTEELLWLKEHPVIRFVQDPGWPPIEFTNEQGEPSGMTLDYINLIQQRLGVTFEQTRGISWQEAYAKLQNWELDMTTSVALTPERAEFWAFTKPYMEIPIVIVAQANVAYIGNLQELSGKKVAVVDGYAICDWLPKDFPDIQLVKVQTAQEGLYSLQRGEVFAFLENMLVVGHFLTKLNMQTTLKIAGNTPYINAQSMAVRKDWAVFAGILDKALDSITEMERNEIYRRWLPVRYEYGFDSVRFWQAISIFSVVLLGLTIWIWLLSREITRRKKAEKASKASEQRFLQLFEFAPLPLGRNNNKGEILEVNNQWKQTFGYSQEEISTLDSWYRLAYPNTSYRSQAVERWEQSLLNSQNSNRSIIEPGDYEITCKNGVVRSMQISGTFVGDSVLVAFFDITDRKKAELEHRRLLDQAESAHKTILATLEEQRRIQRSLQSSNATLDAAINSMTDAVIITDANGRFLHHNQAFINFYRLEDTKENLAKLSDFTSFLEMFSLDGSSAPIEHWPVSRALRGETNTNAEYSLRRKDTGESWVGSYSFAPIRGLNGTIAGTVVVCRDITESKQTEAKILFQRNHDYLTGLFNRGFLENELRRLEEERILPVTVIIADTNGLKLINDSFGHKTGDEILKQTAALLIKSSRPIDTVARYGGDEFVILLPRTNSTEGEKIVRTIEQSAKQIQFESLHITLSLGFSTRELQSEDFNSVFKKAEDMMYRNKIYESASEKNKTIGLVINSLFEKSHRESQHSKRVSEISVKIAKSMGLPEHEINRIRIAGLMHDIGKIGIPENILNKPGKLTSAEWEEMRRHPETGYRILSTASEFSDVSKTILEHHERWDGKGYPRGISGESISLHARIIMIADSYDAMTSERSYKQPMSIQEALVEIHDCAGTHFDPNIANIFTASLPGTL